LAGIILPQLCMASLTRPRLVCNTCGSRLLARRSRPQAIAGRVQPRHRPLPSDRKRGTVQRASERRHRAAALFRRRRAATHWLTPLSAPDPLLAAAMSRNLALVMLGDCMLGRIVDESLTALPRQLSSIWGDTLPLLQGGMADAAAGEEQLVAANLECAVTAEEEKVGWFHVLHCGALAGRCGLHCGCVLGTCVQPRSVDLPTPHSAKQLCSRCNPSRTRSAPLTSSCTPATCRR